MPETAPADIAPARAVPETVPNAVEPAPVAKATPVPYEAGIWVDAANFDPERLPVGYKYENGRITWNRKSNRPSTVLPEVWNPMTPKQKRDELEKQAELATVPTSTVGAVPVLAGVPAMPRIRKKEGRAAWAHRVRKGDPYGLQGLAMVARIVRPKEARANAKARQAMDEEWTSLRSIGTWNEKGVREWADVKREARSRGARVHVGMIL